MPPVIHHSTCSRNDGCPVLATCAMAPALDAVAKVLRVAPKCALKRVSPTSSEIDLVMDITADVHDTMVDLSDRDLTAGSMKVVASMLRHNKVCVCVPRQPEGACDCVTDCCDLPTSGVCAHVGYTSRE